jgi:multidrug efflux pump
VIGGMLGATVIAIFFIPMFFWGLETMSDRTMKKQQASAPHPPEAGAQEPLHAE